MASGRYRKSLEAFLKGDIDLEAANVKVVLVDAADYTVDLDADEFLDDIPVGARVATSANLANKSYALGKFDADDVELTGVSGDTSEAVVVYVDTGNDATSRLLAYLEGSGLPFTPSGGNLLIRWNAAGIFTL